MRWSYPGRIKGQEGGRVTRMNSISAAVFEDCHLCNPITNGRRVENHVESS